jgi:hypothetical protein
VTARVREYRYRQAKGKQDRQRQRVRSKNESRYVIKVKFISDKEEIDERISLWAPLWIDYGVPIWQGKNVYIPIVIPYYTIFILKPVHAL